MTSLAVASLALMVLIPAGEFTMGRSENEDDRAGMRPLVMRDDLPAHKVYLRAFHIDKHEVTNEAYAEFVAATGHPAPRHWIGGRMAAGKERLPVYNVDFDDATAYCEWDGKRLPTEAEWEKAARGGKEGTKYPWGNEISADHLRYKTPKGPAQVGRYPANGYGLFDMAGNVSEWCSDWFDRTYYQKSPAENPAGPDTGHYKVIRGGAFSDDARRSTVFYRNWVKPGQKTPNIGFRCVSETR